MAIQEFNLGGGGVAQMYPLMERYMQSMSQSAEKIGGGIRSAMIQTEANTQAKDMAEQLKGADLFNSDGTSKPDSMTNLMSIMAAHPLGSQTATGQMMFHGLGKQIEDNTPLSGFGAGATNPTAGTSAGLTAPNGSGVPVTAASPDMPVQDNAVDPNASLFGDQTNLITGKPGMEAGGSAVTTNGTQPQAAPVDMFRQQIDAIDRRMSVIQSTLPKTPTKGNQGAYFRAQTAIDRLQTQKDNLARDMAVDKRGDVREERLRDDMTRKEGTATKNQDLAQQRIDILQQRADSSDTKFEKAESRRLISAEMRPLELEHAAIAKQIATNKKNIDLNTTYLATATPDGKALYLRQMKGWQQENKELQQQLDEKNAGLDKLTGMLDGLGKESSVAGKKLDQETAQSIFKEAGGDKEKAREIAKERGYSL